MRGLWGAEGCREPCEGSAGGGSPGTCSPAHDRRGPALSWTPPPAELSLGCGRPGCLSPASTPRAPSIPAEPASARSDFPCEN